MSFRIPFHRTDGLNVMSGRYLKSKWSRSLERELRVTNERLLRRNATVVPVNESLDEERGLMAPFVAVVSAHVLGGVLDGQLADGKSPASSTLLATRAQLIVSPMRRRILAESWLSMITKAGLPSSPRRSLEVPVVRTRILGAETQIRALAIALLAPMVTPRGVAMARSLLSDGSGPVYYGESASDLRSRLQEVITRLNPLTP
jgi:hypothetical protein